MNDFRGFGILGYRSFADEPCIFGPLRKVNLLAGQNNAGKSNAIRVASRFLKAQPDFGLAELDRPNFPRWAEGPMTLRLWLPIEVNWDSELLTRAKQAHPGEHVIRDVLECPELQLAGDNVAWLAYDAEFVTQQNDAFRWVLSYEWVATLPVAQRHDFQHLSAALTNANSNDPVGNLYRILSAFSPFEDLPRVKVLEAFRQIGGSTDFTPDGAPLIDALARLERPGALKQQDKLRFAAINTFLRNVTGEQSAQLEISREEPAEILVGVEGRVLPLSHYGTGIHQVVILASVATLFEGWLLCIEEPEVHLHPILQRKLLRYLQTATDNQYLIATHSAHLLDSVNASIFHVQNSMQGSSVAMAETPESVVSICNDLGYRPSDLLQANVVLWVEGPSDRIYLRHWISLVDDRLIEHVHYSIMFYGGRLLNHLTASDSEVSDFIKLRQLNRHLMVLIDSDKRSESAEVNETKRRVIEEFSESDRGFAWVTWGRTIENYVPPELLSTALSDLGHTPTGVHDGRWADVLRTEAGRDVDKVKLARSVCQRWTVDLELPDDLSQMTTSVVELIVGGNSVDDVT